MQSFCRLTSSPRQISFALIVVLLLALLSENGMSMRDESLPDEFTSTVNLITAAHSHRHSDENDDDTEEYSDSESLATAELDGKELDGNSEKSYSYDYRRPDSAMEHANMLGGDILIRDDPLGLSRSWATNNRQKYWSKGVVPYVISRQVSQLKNLITQAMAEIQKKTCIRFVPRKGQRNYVYMMSGDGCYSELGRSYWGRQVLSLGYGCNRVGIIIHELLHAIGFYHLHTRYDRDKYLKVYEKNIQRGMYSQFAKVSRNFGTLYSEEFDFKSIMLYSKDAFAKRPGLITMEPRDPSKSLPDSSSKMTMSDIDIKSVNTMYSCNRNRNNALPLFSLLSDM